jgi:OOP family OmpA-OmpF porin
MKKISSFILACAGLISIVSSSTASSYPGNRPGLLTLTAGGGYIYLDSKRQMENKGAGMIQLGYDLTENWGVEGMLASFSTHFKRAVNDHRHVSGTIFAINGVYHFLTDSMIQPYVLAGPGITGLSPNQSDANNSGNFNAAVGAQIFFTPMFSLRLEARDLYNWVGARNDVFLNGGLSVSFDLC